MYEPLKDNVISKISYVSESCAQCELRAKHATRDEYVSEWAAHLHVHKWLDNVLAHELVVIRTI